MHYAHDYLPPRELGRQCARRLLAELGMDNAGVCRFHRAWAEEMIPEVFGSLYASKESYIRANAIGATRINSRNAGVVWESGLNADFVRAFLERRRDIEADDHPDLLYWIGRFEKDRKDAALDFWFEIRKGIDESLRDFS